MGKSRRFSELAAVERVQAAFRLGLARPATRPFVFSRRHGPRARPAADRRITLIVQRVIRHVVGHDKRPDVALRPAQERVDLHQVELGRPSRSRRPDGRDEDWSARIAVIQAS